MITDFEFSLEFLFFNLETLNLNVLPKNEEKNKFRTNVVLQINDVTLVLKNRFPTKKKKGEKAWKQPRKWTYRMLKRFRFKLIVERKLPTIDIDPRNLNNSGSNSGFLCQTVFVFFKRNDFVIFKCRLHLMFLGIFLCESDLMNF